MEKPNVRSTEALAMRDGRRWCSYCFQLRDAEGGKWVERPRCRLFYCSTCLVKRSRLKAQRKIMSGEVVPELILILALLVALMLFSPHILR
jgi:hypothetical protein